MSAKQPIIGVDLDGVCHNFIHTLREYLIEKTGRPRSDFPPEKTWWFFINEWNMSMEEYIKWMNIGIKEKQIFWCGPQIENALWGVSELYKLGYYIKFITARGSRNADMTEQCKRATYHWLNTNGFPYDEIIISYDKTNYEFDLLIDDSPENYEACVATNKRMLIFEQPYNIYLSDAPRAKNWIEVVEYVKENFPLQESMRAIV